MAIQKIIEHLKTENGYDTVHRETQADMVLNNDGKTTQDHIDAGIASEAGAHGFRYNAEAEAFEVLNEDTGEWEEVSSASGGGGTALGAVTGLSTLVASEKAYIKWTDPEDIELSGVKLAEWAGTLLVRKAGSAPANRRDGTVVIDSKVRDAYKTSYLVDSGLSNGVTYYYKFFPYSTSKVYTDSENNAFTLTPNPVAPGNVSGVTAAAAGNGKAAIQWSDPDDTVTDGITISQWASTKVVYKTGGYPTDPTDGTLALNNTTKDAYKTNALTVSGLTNGTTYYFAFFPVSADGAVNTDASNRITVVPNRIPISAPPTQTNIPTYNGSAKTPTWSGYDTAKMTLGGTTTGTNAGSYNATFTPKDDYCWSDGSTTAKIVAWKINQAAGTLSANPTSITLDKDHLTATFTIGGNHDGTLSVSSNDTSVATVSRNGNTVTVSHVNKKTGTAKITLSCGAGTNYTAPSNVTVNVTAKFVTIYGVEWDGTSTTKWSRTDASATFTDPVPAVNNGSGSSPFDNLAPWNGMVKSNDTAGGVLVAIPKYYYKLTKSGNKLKLQIADGEVEGFKVSPAHANRGDGKGERDVVYVGRYHCVSGYKSATGAQQVSITRATARSGIHNLGSAYWQWDWAMNWTIKFLYLVEFADWNSQAKIGYGCSASGSKVNNGQTDAMTYHTGTTAANRTTYGYTQYRNIEGLWDNVYDWVDGCYYNGSGLNVIMNPNNFSDSANGTLIGAVTGGWPSAFDVCATAGYEWCIRPTAASGSESTYLPDNWNFSSSYPCLFVGGYYGRYQYHGLFFVGYNAASSTVSDFGSRLMKLS